MLFICIQVSSVNVDVEHHKRAISKDTSEIMEVLSQFLALYIAVELMTITV